MLHYFPYCSHFYPVIFCKAPRYRYPEFPPVNPQIFMDSAKQSSLLLKEAGMLLHSIGTSADLSKKIMIAAQQSKEKEVLQLLKQTGIASDVRVMYNPDGIQIELSQSRDKITLALRWSQ